MGWFGYVRLDSLRRREVRLAMLEVDQVNRGISQLAVEVSVLAGEVAARCMVTVIRPRRVAEELR